tara:strand:+ start:1516 stop:2517 length:1002 start_codon:yes stop_codon:yes gene_type:complete
MGKLRKIGKKIGRGIKSVGKKFKKGLGKIAKAFGKLGPLGSIALSFMLPGIGSWISSVAQGSSFLQPIAQGLVNAGNFVKNGVGKVFNKVTDAIEYSMNKVSSFAGGEGMAGSNFKNWVSETTGGFIEPSTEGIKDMSTQASTKVLQTPGGKEMTFEVPETTISAEAQVGIGGPKIPKPPKGMKDPVFVDGIDTDLKKGFYAEAELNKFYKGEPVGATLSDSATESYSTTIQSSKGVTPPKPGNKYFQRSKNAYKAVGPISTAGQSIQAGEDAEKFAKDMAQKQQAAYFADVAQTTLMKQPDPTTNLIDFNNPNPSTQDIYNLTNAYGGILGT